MKQIAVLLQLKWQVMRTPGNKRGRVGGEDDGEEYYDPQQHQQYYNNDFYGNSTQMYNNPHTFLTNMFDK